MLIAVCPIKLKINASEGAKSEHVFSIGITMI